jgi:hypothetical protein
MPAVAFCRVWLIVTPAIKVVGWGFETRFARFARRACCIRCAAVFNQHNKLAGADAPLAGLGYNAPPFMLLIRRAV